MNAIQDCMNQLKRISQSLRVSLQNTASECQCDAPPKETAVQQVSTCGCGQDACQIGDGTGACKPQSQPLVERV